MFVYKQLLRILKHRGEDLILFSVVMRAMHISIGSIVAFLIGYTIELKTGELGLNAEFLNWIDWTYAMMLIGSGMVLLFVSVIEVIGLIYISHSYERGERPTLFHSFTYAYSKSLALGQTYGLPVGIVAVLAFLLFPLINIGPSVFSQFSIPSFVTAELITTHKLQLISWVLFAVLGYVVYRFIFAFHIFSTRAVSFIGACKASWMITSRRKNFRELFTLSVVIPVVASLSLLVGTVLLGAGVMHVLQKIIVVFTSILPNQFIVLFYSMWVFCSTAGVSLLIAPISVSILTAYLESRHPQVLGIESVRHIARQDIPFIQQSLIKPLFHSKKNIVLFGIVVSLCFVGISKQFLRIIQVTPGVLEVVAHRGLINREPETLSAENTLRSFTQSIQIGADGIEADLQMLKDGTVIFFHDEKIKTSDGEIVVTDLTYQELVQYGIEVTPLAELVKSKIFTCDTKWFFEIKEYTQNGSSYQILDAVREIAREHDMFACISVGSFNVQRVYEFKRYAPELNTNLYVYNLVRDISRTINLDAIDSLSIEEKLVTSRLTRAFVQRQKPVYAWTINEVSEIDTLSQFGVTGIITDIPIESRGYISSMTSPDTLAPTTYIVELFGTVFALDPYQFVREYSREAH